MCYEGLQSIIFDIEIKWQLHKWSLISTFATRAAMRLWLTERCLTESFNETFYYLRGRSRDPDYVSQLRTFCSISARFVYSSM
jgi:hypothetical protein